MVFGKWTEKPNKNGKLNGCSLGLFGFEEVTKELNRTTTWPETQVSPGRVKAGLRDHDAASSGASKTHRRHYENRVDRQSQTIRPSVIFDVVGWNSLIRREMT